MTNTTATTTATATAAAAAEGVKVTKISAGRARGVNKRTAPQTTAKVTRGQKAMGMVNAPKKGKPVDAPAAKGKGKVAAKAKDKAPAKGKATSGATFTSVDLAAEQGINAKTLRARIRRNIDKWAPLFVNGERHVFADNAATRKAVAALLAD